MVTPRSEDSPPVVAIVGAGTIGSSWTLLFARAGFDVRVFDQDPGQLTSLPERLRAYIASIEDAAASKATRSESAAVWDRITTTAVLAEALGGAAHVQESVPESLEAKRGALAAIDAIAGPECTIGSSASTIPMSEIAVNLRHPERCVVAHPTNPPHIFPLVEIVPGRLTAAATVDAVTDLMRRIGQVPILCRKEIFGFVLNRLQFALVREAFTLARQGVASPADIDRCVTEGLGPRWAMLGPYLVEETNASSIEIDLRKFGPGIRDLLSDLRADFDGPTDQDIGIATEGVAELLEGRTRADVLRLRDTGGLRIRQLKEELA